MDEIFFVAEADGVVFGTAMAGYDGHRGWLYAIAVHPHHKNRGVGRDLVNHSEPRISMGKLLGNL